MLQNKPLRQKTLIFAATAEKVHLISRSLEIWYLYESFRETTMYTYLQVDKPKAEVHCKIQL